METHVISLSAEEHLDVWALTSRLLPSMVPADRYTVYVPEAAVGEFRRVTDERIKVESDGILGASFSEELAERLRSAGNSARYSWYLQQYLKIEALRLSQAELRGIWDADCVPVQPIRLFSDGGRPQYALSDEHNPRYFDVTERLFGLRQIAPGSFIVPGFPLKGAWLVEFLKELELAHGCTWYEALMRSTDFALQSGFSEYETLGTWIVSRYGGESDRAQYTWERFGSSRFGSASRFTPDEIVALAERNGIDVVSFEAWDRRGVRSTLRALRRNVHRWRNT